MRGWILLTVALAMLMGGGADYCLPKRAAREDCRDLAQGRRMRYGVCMMWYKTICEPDREGQP